MSYSDNLSRIDKGSPRSLRVSDGGVSGEDDGASKADWNLFLTGISKYTNPSNSAGVTWCEDEELWS